jgi:hypothetical protein
MCAIKCRRGESTKRIQEERRDAGRKTKETLKDDVRKGNDREKKRRDSRHGLPGEGGDVLSSGTAFHVSSSVVISPPLSSPSFSLFFVRGVNVFARACCGYTTRGQSVSFSSPLSSRRREG